jgi:hypothetical protein
MRAEQAQAEPPPQVTAESEPLASVEAEPRAAREDRARAPAPRREEPRADAPRVDPKELLDSAGLVMIETDRSKVTVQPVVEDAQPVGRPRRERPKTASQEGELVQIETRK